MGHHWGRRRPSLGVAEGGGSKSWGRNDGLPNRLVVNRMMNREHPGRLLINPEVMLDVCGLGQYMIVLTLGYTTILEDKDTAGRGK